MTKAEKLIERARQDYYSGKITSKEYVARVLAHDEGNAVTRDALKKAGKAHLLSPKKR